jgi:hypothetical protein
MVDHCNYDRLFVLNISIDADYASVTFIEFAKINSIVNLVAAIKIPLTNLV